MRNPSPQPKNGPIVIQRVVNTITRHDMFAGRQRVLVGVSGGPDSTALLHILIALMPRYDIELAIAHFHHGLRQEAADNDAVFVRQMARRLDLPFHMEKADLKMENGSIEEQAREARYAFFRRLMSEHGYTRLALGHQKNDNAEAVLMHLLRGSGIRGLGGIPPVRDHWVVRPLMDLERSEIMAWLKDEAIAYVEDATNADPAYERNRIRHQLIPLLAETYNPNIVDILHRTADLCREEDAWLTRRLQPLLEEAVTVSDRDQLEIDLAVIAAEPLAAQRRLIRDALHRWHGHLRRMTASHIDTLVGLLPEQEQGKRISLPFGIEAERRPHRLRFTRIQSPRGQIQTERLAFYYKVPEETDFPLTIEIEEAHCRLIFEKHAPGPRIELGGRDENRAVFDLDALSFPLSIRNFKPGDRITPYGLHGSQKIKKIFIDRKIPAAHRLTIPLLESGGAVVWIAGVRRSRLAALAQDTRQILEVRIERSMAPGAGSRGRKSGIEPENHA